jgi:hypothetical protein
VCGGRRRDELRATDLAEDDARQQAADLNVIFNQYGQRDQADRREVSPPIEVESATWSTAGDLDYPVKERQEWWGGYGVQTDITYGSELLIYVPPKSTDSTEAVGLHSQPAQLSRPARPVTCPTDPQSDRYARHCTHVDSL